MRKMANKFVHFLRRLHLKEGGVARAVLDICSLLATRGHDVTLLTVEGMDVPADWESGAKNLPRVVTIPAPSFFRGVSPEVDRVLHEASVLHMHTPWDLSNLWLARRAGQLKIPYIVSVHGMLDEWSVRQRWLKKWLYLALAGRRFLAGAALIHCTATAELRQIKRFIRRGSGMVLPYVIDLSAYAAPADPDQAFREFPELCRDASRLLFLGRLHPKKRPDILIEAAAKLKKSGHTCQLILAGPGDQTYVAALQQLAVQYDIADMVLFPGMIHGCTKTSMYLAADVFVLPTSQENFGIVLIEAMASGMPVVTTFGVDIWEEIQSGGAIIVEQDVDQIAAAIRSLISDIPTAKQRGQKGREWVFRELNADRVIDTYEKMYRDVRLCAAPK